jgi:hypothetical protein
MVSVVAIAGKFKGGRCDFFQLPLVPDTPRGHQRGRSSQSSINSLEVHLNPRNKKAETGLGATESLEQVVRQLQGEVGLHDTQNPAIHNARRAENFADLIIMPARAFIRLPHQTSIRRNSTEFSEC